MAALGFCTALWPPESETDYLAASPLEGGGGKVKLPVLRPGLRGPRTFYTMKCIETVTGLVWGKPHTRRGKGLIVTL